MTDDSGSWDERRLIENGFERIHAELDRYDGPWKGLADVNGVPHYFNRMGPDALDDPYAVWPASREAVDMEREQWAIFIRELDGEKTEADASRHKELESLLEPHRETPADARRLMAEWRFDDRDERYDYDGIDQWVRWRPVE
ncbi:hypothetical protein [Spirillospora sp. CA-294931]|uniref:hypothetical protein n=1 Tax=Spirillospora sp. CA-294931 TaxID=3240042 RepID=UPI003D8AADC8